MKLVKTQVCLYLYEQLLTVGHVEIEEIKKNFNLENKTFSRYINEIRAYLYNFYKGKEIVYYRDEHRYYLVSNNKNDEYISNANSLAPCKVIGRADKPNPKIMKMYLESVGIEPKNAVMVGDRPLTDILAGKLLGCKTILVGSINPNENLPTKFVRSLERSTIRK